MAQPLPIQRPLLVRAQEVLANVLPASQAPVPGLPVPQQDPQAAPAVPTHVATPKNADDGNVNQIAGPPAAPGPPLEVRLPFLLNSRLLGLYALLFFGLFCFYTLRL